MLGHFTSGIPEYTSSEQNAQNMSFTSEEKISSK